MWIQVYQVVWGIQLAMGILSILGSSSIIVCLLTQRLSRKPELQPLFLLSVADLLLAACWLVGAVLFCLRCAVLNSLCYNLHILEQVFFMASFCFTLNYVWNLFTAIREKFNSCQSGHSVQVSNRVSTTAKVIAVLSWLGPVLFMLPVFIMGNMSVCQSNSSQPYKCLLMHTDALYRTAHGHQLSASCSGLHTYRMVVFLLTFLFTLVIITGLVIRARHFHIRAVASNGIVGAEQRVALRVLNQRVVLYPLVFVLCWGPAVALAFLRVAKPSTGHGRAAAFLYIAQALTSASQGFLNCLVYGWTTVPLRQVGLTALSRDANTQTPLLQPQPTRNYKSLRALC
ncbi:transmembrane protein 116 isoform X2 [Oryzias latipes]|uniref:transmembrane protein 116 isoform X2 n=1 Tax=Oryzias latipes TaxID=8090 RepID=UPI000CE28A01|nr:transmembrane protein 116 isoform X2 [Oryzias latipes]